ncbi:MAG: O-antigen polymerase, partial [Ignavibacteria bacterium]|nr:O-antigen polymerase [Ignavibacteria bacterium]
TLKYFIIFFSVLSLYSAIEFWMVLINRFGSIPAVLLNAKVIYRLNISGELIGTTPYIYLFATVPVFFAGIYAAYKGRFTLLTFIPLISIIIKETGGGGRAGMLIALIEFAFSFFLFRHLLNNDFSNRFKFSKVNILIAPIILIALFILGSSLVRITRGSEASENISGATRELRQTKGNIIISPSVYLYASCDIGVLSKYLISEGDNTGFGQNTFMPFYLILAKYNIIKRPSEYQRGYFIPMWANTGTYLRELHADFGIIGIFFGPFLIGLLITWSWFKFYEKKSLIVFAFLVYLNLIVGLSFFIMATRVTYWYISLVMILLCIPLIEKIALIVYAKNYN